MWLWRGLPKHICKNACFAINCVQEFEQTTKFFRVRYNEAQRRMDFGETLSPHPCKDGRTGDERWRVASDRTAGDIAATDMDDFFLLLRAKVALDES